MSIHYYLLTLTPLLNYVKGLVNKKYWTSSRTYAI